MQLRSPSRAKRPLENFECFGLINHIIQASFNTCRGISTHAACHVVVLTCDTHHTCGPSNTDHCTERTEICTGKERPHQNDVREIGTCRTRPGHQAGTHTITVSGALPAKCAPDAHEGRRLEARGFDSPSVPQLAAPMIAASAVVVAVVVG